MKNQFYISIFSSMVLAFSFQSCMKTKTYPSGPVIEFKNLTQFKDSVRIVFSFTDGDGDIGLGENEIQAPYEAGTYFYDNVHIGYFAKVDGTWTQPLSPDGIPIEFGYRIQPIEPKGKNKALKGDVIIYVTPFFDLTPSHADTLKFRITMVDRALHISNTVETGEIVR